MSPRAAGRLETLGYQAYDDVASKADWLAFALPYADHHRSVTELMQEGPTTVRPSEELAPLQEWMDNAEVDAVLVTRSDGRLLGMSEHTVGGHALDEEADDDADR